MEKKYSKKPKKAEKKVDQKEKDLEIAFKNVYLHYQDADSELQTRITHKERGFDVYDKLFRNYIDPSKWPFDVRVPDGRASTLLNRKADRLIATKLQGKLIPRRSGSELGAKIGTELLLWEWTENDMRGDQPMLQRWRRMDIATRKYGAAFGLCGWDKIHDIPTFEPLNNRDVLVQPGARSIDSSEWVQVRRYVFLSELERINAMSVVGPIYDPDAISYIRKKKASNTNYTSVNRDIIGLGSSLDEKIEIINEYSPDKFYSFCLMGSSKETNKVPLRSFKNPYDHKEIPIVRLVYDPIDDDIYGRPELENIAPLIKAEWSLLSQTLEQLQNDLYTPLMVNPKRASVDTLNFGRGKRWFMETPGQDVVPYQSSTVGLTKFKEHFGLISSLIMEGIGETGQDISNISNTLADKTATEVKDMALLRSARDNANKLMLSAALSKMTYFWFKMSQQYIDGHKLIRIQGKEALQYLVEEGLNGWTLKPEGFEMISQTATENKINFDDAYSILREQGALEEYAVPLYPLENPDMPTKLELEKDGKAGFLAVSSKDIAGDYDFIPDVEAMSISNDQSLLSARNMMFEAMQKVEPKINEQGYRIKWKEFIEKLGDTARIPDSEVYFEQAPQQPPQQEIQQPTNTNGLSLTPTAGPQQNLTPTPGITEATVQPSM